MTSRLKGDRAARQCIEKYLGEINAVLGKAGTSRGEIQNIVDDVRAQIAEMLASRTQGEPTLQDAQAVIAELDAPESYAAETESLERKPPVLRRLSKHALWGALIPPVFLLVAAMLARNQMELFDQATSLKEAVAALWSTFPPLAFFLLASFICPFVLGSIAVSKIRRSRGRLYGLRLAFVEVLIGHLVVLAILSQVLTMLLCRLLGFPGKSVQGWALAIWCILAWFLGRYVWRSIRKPVPSGESA